MNQLANYLHLYFVMKSFLLSHQASKGITTNTILRHSWNPNTRFIFCPYFVVMGFLEVRWTNLQNYLCLSFVIMSFLLLYQNNRGRTTNSIVWHSWNPYARFILRPCFVVMSFLEERWTNLQNYLCLRDDEFLIAPKQQRKSHHTIQATILI